MSDNAGQFNAAIEMGPIDPGSGWESVIEGLSAEAPVLIAGPTASGKSKLALDIAETQGGVIVNADAIQVFENWRVLTARPGPEDLLRAPHRLYGHVAWDADYSVGYWLRDVKEILRDAERPIIVGGTGLYFTALTEGLAEIPPTPPEVRAEADRMRAEDGLEQMIAGLDVETRARLDLNNPMRVQRAWEVQQATGLGLAQWQARTPPPVLPLSTVQALRVDAERDWLNERIARRFDMMLAEGALQEAQENLERYDPVLLSFKAIGAPELIAHLLGEIPLSDARKRATVATCQFAKRQRTWLRSKMSEWRGVQAQSI